MSYIISSGITSDGIILENDSMTVLDGGVASTATVNSQGHLHISSGGTAENTTVNSQGYLYISSGGTAENTTVNSQGHFHISSGGKANSATMNGGSMYVSSGGVANNNTVYGSATLRGDGTVNNTVVQGGSFSISGGVANIVSVSNEKRFNGHVFISSRGSISVCGGSLNSVTVNPGGMLEFMSGTVTNIIENGGYVKADHSKKVSFAANTISGLILTSNNSATVHSGTTANSTVISEGSLLVFSGGTADAPTVHGKGACLFLSSGGVANNARIIGNSRDQSIRYDTYQNYSSGGICVFSGGTANGTIMSGGTLFIGRGGVANDTVVNCSANPNPVFGGMIINGVMIVSGGTANNTVVKGVCNSTFQNLSGGIVEVIGDAGVINNTSVGSGGRLIVRGMANDTVVGGYPTLHGSTQYDDVYSGTVDVLAGTATRITVNYGGNLNVRGGTVLGIVENGGCVNATPGKEVTFVPNTFSGLILSSPVSGGTEGISATVHSGTTAVDVTTMDGGFITVFSGGKLTGKITDLGGSISALEGAVIDYDLTGIAPGTTALIYDLSRIEGTPTYTVTVATNQTEGIYTLADGSEGFNGTIAVTGSDGTILGELTLNETVIISGVGYTLSLTDSALSLKVGDDSTPSLYTADGMVLIGESVSIKENEVYHDTLVGSGGMLDVKEGTADGVNVLSGGSIYIAGQGTIDNVSVVPGGIVTVFGSATHVVENGGYVDVQKGAEVSFVPNTFSNAYVMTGQSATLHSGTTACDLKLAGNLDIYDGGVASSVEALHVYRSPNDNFSIQVYSGGMANGVRLTHQSCTLVIYNGGVVNDTYIVGASEGMSSKYNCFISSGGIANRTELNSYGGMNVLLGGIANDTILNGGKLYVSSGGTAANDTTVNVGGRVIVSRGGSVMNAIENGGYVDVSSGAVVFFASHTFSGLQLTSDATIHSGTTAVDVTVSSAGLYIYSGGIVNDANAINCSGGGRYINQGILVSSGGTANRALLGNRGLMCVFLGGTANDTMVYGNGNMYVSSRGTANDTVVSMNGSMTVSKGGVVNGLTVNSRGCLTVSEGGKLTGQITIENGAIVRLYGNVDFDISKLAPEAEKAALVKNLSLIQGVPTNTLTVSNSQSDGAYTLAEGATEFNSTITVQNTSGDKLATLTVGSEEDLSGTKYSLKLEDDVLSVTLSKLLPAENPADKDTVDYLYDKKKGMNADAENFETNILNADTTLINVDQKFSIYNTDSSGKLWHNFVGIDDTTDFAKFTLEHAATLSFNLDATDATKFTVWSLTEGKDKKGNTTWTQKSLQSTTLKKVKGSTDYAATTKALLLSAGDYYVSMQSTNKKNGYALYNVTLSEDSTFYSDGDNTDDWTDMKENGASSEEYAIIGTITAKNTTLLDNWVGFGDSVDYAQFSLDSASNLSFVANATDATKFTVYKLTQDKKGKWTLKSLQSTTLKKAKKAEDYTATTKGLLLESGEYYIAMESTNAKKGGDADYAVKLNDGASVFYVDADDGANGWLYDKKSGPNKAVCEADAIVIHSASTDIRLDSEKPDAEGRDNFVGFGDEADYRKIKLETDAALSFAVTASDACKFMILSLAEGVDKKGQPKCTVKTLQTTKLSKPKGGTEYAATTGTLELAAGEYYVAVQSTNAKKGGAAWYNVSLNLDGCAGLQEAKDLDALSAGATASPTSDVLALTDALNLGLSGADAVPADAIAAPFAAAPDDAIIWRNADMLA